VIGLLLALYPASWRRRYGEEFRAVLEERPLGPFDVADVLLGALDARSRQLRFAGAPASDGGQMTMLRVGGFGAIAGGILWAGAFIGGTASAGESSPVWFGLFAVGCVAILVALVGLSAFQARTEPKLAWAAFLVPAAGLLLSLMGIYGLFALPEDLPMVGGLAPWSVWILGFFSTALGSVLFAIATFRARVLTRWGAVALAVSAVAFAVIGLLGMGFIPALSEKLFAVTIVAFGGSWVWLGASALRRGPIRSIAPA